MFQISAFHNGASSLADGAPSPAGGAEMSLGAGDGFALAEMGGGAWRATSSGLPTAAPSDLGQPRHANPARRPIGDVADCD
jgi:hypothetical protein